jgi:hypothetical protein
LVDCPGASLAERDSKMASIGAGASLTPSSTIATVFPVAEIIAAVDSLIDAMLAQGAIPILIFSIQSGLYAQFP